MCLLTWRTLTLAFFAVSLRLNLRGEALWRVLHYVVGGNVWYRENLWYALVYDHNRETGHMLSVTWPHSGSETLFLSRCLVSETSRECYTMSLVAMCGRETR